LGSALAHVSISLPLQDLLHQTQSAGLQGYGDIAYRIMLLKVRF
jgi:hypothetical protein